jgi:hypothetical protein
MSTSAQPLGTRPPMLNHRDVILNIYLYQWSPHEYKVGDHTLNQLSLEENDTPITWALSWVDSTQSRGERILENVTRHCNHQQTRRVLIM